QLFTACAHAAAHFHGATEAAVVGVIEPGARFGCAVRGAKTKIRRERGRIDDLAGIEDAFGIERALHFTESAVELRPEHSLHEWPGYEPVAVPTEKSAAVFEYEVRDGIGNGLEFCDSVARLQVDDRPDVKTTDGSVGVDSSLCVVLTEDAKKA